MRADLRRFVFALLACSIVICGRDLSAQITATPASLDLGDVGLTATKDGEITIKANQQVIVQDLLFSGGNAEPSEFEILAPSLKSFVLEANDEKKVVIRFAPNYDGFRSTRLTVQTNLGDFYFDVFGMGKTSNPVLSLSHVHVSFGKVAKSGRIDTIVTLESTGEDLAKISATSIANANNFEHFIAAPEDPSVSLPVILSQSERLRLKVSFVGSDLVGFKSGSMTLVGDVGGQVTISFDGEVVDGSLIVQPVEIDFGIVMIGETKRGTVTLRSGPDVPINLAYVGDPPTPEFTFIGKPAIPRPLSPNEAVTFDVEFKPAVIGPVYQEVALISPDFQFTKFALRATVIPSPLELQGDPDFTYYCASKTPIERRLQLQNTGAAALRVNSVTVSSAAARITTTLPLDIPAQASSEIVYTFDPALLGPGDHQIDVEYLSESGVMLRHRVYARALTASIDVDHVKINEREYSVHTTTDISPLGFTEFPIQLSISKPDLFSLKAEDITLNQALLPGATFDLTEQTLGRYRITIRSPQPITVDNTLPDSDKALFTYKLTEFLSIDSSASVTVGFASEEGDECVTVENVSTVVTAEAFCGDNTLRDQLAGVKLLRSVGIYPNPSTSTRSLLLNASQPSSYTITLFDQLGVEVYRGEFTAPAGGSQYPIDLPGLDAGTYIVRLFSKEHQVEHTLKLTVLN